MNNIKIDKKKALVITFGIVIFLAALFVFSYAYMETSIEGDDPSEFVITSDNMTIVFDDSNEINVSGLLPGMSIVKNFYVQNSGTKDLFYKLSIIDIYNTFGGGDLVYTLSRQDLSVDETVIPNENTTLLENVYLAPNARHSYTLTIKFLSKNEDQTSNMGASFSAKLSLESLDIKHAVKYLTNNVNNISSLYQISQAATGQQNYATVEYRYQGSNSNVNNWVYFNCTSYSETLDTGKEVNVHDNTKQCEKWRIVGAFQTEDGGEYHLKIIRNDRINPGTASSFQDGWYWAANESTPNWEESDLQKYLNNETTGLFNLTGTESNYDGYLGLLSSTSQDMIYEAKWYLGNTNINITSLETYQNERSLTVHSGNPTYWYGKVGLIYASDYAYASLNCYQTGKTGYSTNNDGVYDTDTCKNSNWMFKGINEWTISPCIWDSTSVGIDYSGNVQWHYYATNAVGVRPVVYLKSNIAIVKGTGTEVSPWTLAILN